MNRDPRGQDPAAEVKVVAIIELRLLAIVIVERIRHPHTFKLAPASLQRRPEAGIHRLIALLQALQLQRVRVELGEAVTRKDIDGQPVAVDEMNAAESPLSKQPLALVQIQGHEIQVLLGHAYVRGTGQSYAATQTRCTRRGVNEGGASDFLGGGAGCRKRGYDQEDPCQRPGVRTVNAVELHGWNGLDWIFRCLACSLEPGHTQSLATPATLT